MIRSPPERPPRLTSTLRRLHRYSGITAGFILVYLVATGVPLQFTDSLKLGSRYVTATAILDYYQLQAPETVLFDNGVAQVGERLFWQTHELGEVEQLIGSVSLQDLIVVGTSRALLVFAPDEPTTIDRIDFAERLLAIAATDTGVLLQTAGGVKQLDAELLNAADVSDPPEQIAWRTPRLLSAREAAPYQASYRGGLLSLERLLQDLHSGRTFGTIGIWTINLATLLLVGLAITGYWIWWRSKPR